MSREEARARRLDKVKGFFAMIAFGLILMGCIKCGDKATGCPAFPIPNPYVK